MAHEFLRHTLATLAYRSLKTVRNAPEGFAEFQVSPGSRTPVEILAHMGDLMEWAESFLHGKGVWAPVAPGSWEETAARYGRTMEALDRSLAECELEEALAKKLFQGPLADALTHTGQLAMLRRAFGAPVRGENYFVANMEAGVVGFDQPAPKREFD